MRRKSFKALLGVVLSASIFLGSIVGGSEIATYAAQTTGSYQLATNIQDGNILHCFDWKYTDIMYELPNIAKAGFSAVQTSPAQQPAYGGSEWYYLYQPKGFRVGTSNLGSEDDLKRLCSEADKYGIKVVVDVVANHLAGNKNDSDLPYSDCYHNEGDAWNWTDRRNITHGKIGMEDLNSENSYVQSQVKNYIQQLKADGVDGIRWDAAKHICLPSEGCGFWTTVIDRSMYNYGEILVGPIDQSEQNRSTYAINLMKEYASYMSVSDSVYSQSVSTTINNGRVPASNYYGSWTVSGIADNKVVYYAESHDTYANDTNENAWSKYISQENIDRAYALVGSKNGPAALYFSRPYSTDKNSIKSGQKGSTNFTNKTVTAVNKLHNACIGEPDYYATNADCTVASVTRKSGATIVCGGWKSGYVSVPNGGSYLACGEYTDLVSGNKFYVSNSTISGTVGNSGVAVLLRTVQPTTVQPTTVQPTTVQPTTVQPTTVEPTTVVPTTTAPVTEMVTVYFSNNFEWNEVYAYTWGKNSNTNNWPGTKMTYVGKNEYQEDIYKIEISKDVTGLILSNGAGSQTVDIKGGMANNTGYYIAGWNGSKLSVGTYQYK